MMNRTPTPALPEMHLLCVEARGLPSSDPVSMNASGNAVPTTTSTMSGRSDPYVVVKLKGLAHLLKSEKQNSPVVMNNNNPVWNWEFILHPTKTTDVIDIRVYDQDRVGKDSKTGKDKYLGKALLPVAEYINRGPIDLWLPLFGVGKMRVPGEIRLVVDYGTNSRRIEPALYNSMGQGMGYSSQPLTTGAYTTTYATTSSFPSTTSTTTVPLGSLNPPGSVTAVHPTAMDRNGNGIPDSLERQSGYTTTGLTDLNRNGIPDQMERGTTTYTTGAPTVYTTTGSNIVRSSSFERTNATTPAMYTTTGYTQTGNLQQPTVTNIAPEFHLLVVEARGLVSSDPNMGMRGSFGSLADAYAVAKLKGLAHLFKSEKQNSPVVMNNNNPVWNWSFLLHPTKTNDVIDLRIYDSNAAGRDSITGKDKYLGKALIPVADFFNRGPSEMWLPLFGKSKLRTPGEIRVVVDYGTGARRIDTHRYEPAYQQFQQTQGQTFTQQGLPQQGFAQQGLPQQGFTQQGVFDKTQSATPYTSQPVNSQSNML